MRPIDADELECVYAILPQDASEDYKEGYGDGMNYVLEIVDDLPTIASVKWIPVSERLPEVGQSVLLSVGKGKYPAEGFLKSNGTWAQYRWSANLENVDAWAEMPEPWKGVDDETD